MAIVTMDQLIAGLNASQKCSFIKSYTAPKAAGDMQSMWAMPGMPGAGAAYGSTGGGIPTNATAGSIGQANPGGSNTLYLAQASGFGSLQGVLLLYDRLWHNSGLSGTVTGAQSAASGALSRYATGVGNEAFAEIYGAIGSSAETLTLTYTDASLGAASATLTTIATPVVGELMPFLLPAGATGVEATTSAAFTTSTGTAGNFGITIAHRICEIPIIAGDSGFAYDAIDLGLPQIQSGACLFWVWLPSAATAGVVMGSLTFAQG